MTRAPASGEGSFTQQVVAELAPHVPVLPCCRRALLAGMLHASDTPGVISTTRLAAARAAMHTLHTDSIAAHVERVAAPRRTRYTLSAVPTVVIDSQPARLCCTRTRLRGAFLCAGRLQRPDSGPYLEIACGSASGAESLLADCAALGIPAGLRRRRGRWLLTVRSAAAVGALLSSIGSQSGRLAYEAGRVVREVRSSVNRTLNAETANLRRAAGAGVAQLAALDALEDDERRWTLLPPALREAATLRRRHPQEDLAALAARAGCSRSAMAGRLRRLVIMAEGG